MNLELKDEYKKGSFGKITAAAGDQERWAGRGNYNRFNEKELKPSYKPEDQLRIFKNFLVSKYSNYFSSKPYPEDFLATLWNNILEPKSQEGFFSHHKRIRNALIFMGVCAAAIMGAGYYGFVQDAKPPMQRLEEKINKESPPEVKKLSPEEAAKKMGENFGKPAK
jgi:hypothetical protein